MTGITRTDPQNTIHQDTTRRDTTRRDTIRRDTGDKDVLDADTAEVLQRELHLLKPAVRAEPGAVLAMLHADFTEISASGRVRDRSGVVEALSAEPARTGQEPDGLRPRRARITELACAWLAPCTIQVTYTSQEHDRTTRRNSIWIRDGDGPWLMRFHQGTVIPQPPG